MKIDLTLPKAVVMAAMLLVVGGLVWKGILPTATIYVVLGWLGLASPIMQSPGAPVPVDIPVLSKMVAMHLAAKEEEAGK
jgi:hypothetical protein